MFAYATEVEMPVNQGCDLDLGLIRDVYVNAWCLHDLAKRISRAHERVQGRQRAEWLLNAVTYLDLTTLSGDDTCSHVTRLTQKAINPISGSVLKRLNYPEGSLTTAAVCVYPSRVTDVVATLNRAGQKIDVAAVSTGFPTGLYSLESRLMQIRDCVQDGATEIDIVIDRSLVLTGEWQKLYDELLEMKKACGTAMMKTILGVGELGNYRNIYKASLVAMMAGSDFIKTSTGKEAINATYLNGTVMMRAIRDYYALTNHKVGFKAAGGIKTVNDALNWLTLVKKELGDDWLNRDLFRIGASSLLQDIEKELGRLAINTN